MTDDDLATGRKRGSDMIYVPGFKVGAADTAERYVLDLAYCTRVVYHWSRGSCELDAIIKVIGTIVWCHWPKRRVISGGCRCHWFDARPLSVMACCVSCGADGGEARVS